MLTAFIYCMNVCSLFSALWESGSLKIGWKAIASGTYSTTPGLDWQRAIKKHPLFGVSER